MCPSDKKINTDIIVPNTHVSPKDKVSNLTWNNDLIIGKDLGIITITKPEEFGCIVNLNYEKIIGSEDVITGAELSNFDRSTYDALVTLYVAGNSKFTTTDIWRVISQNPRAKLTEPMRKKIIQSISHISRFFMTIVTDHSDKTDSWNNLNKDKNSPFKPERKRYQLLQSTYTGRLIDFKIIGYHYAEVTQSVDGKNITKKIANNEIWQILSTPILYEYAKAKGQIASVPMNYIQTGKSKENNTSVRRGNHTDELITFLSREIDTMKKNKTYSRIILLDHIYSMDGIDEVQQDKNNLKKKKKRIRDKLEKILTRFKENNFIRDYTFHKQTKGKNSYFYSVEISF